MKFHLSFSANQMWSVKMKHSEEMIRLNVQFNRIAQYLFLFNSFKVFFKIRIFIIMKVAKT